MLGILAFGAHPGLYQTPQDVARLRANVTRFQWGSEYATQMKSSAGKWVAMSDDQLRAIVPAPGSSFAYGFAGCPACGASWASWGGGGLCSLDQPNKVTCTKCERVFPDADYPDAGSGWHDPMSGKTYYFIGVYNAQAAQEITLHGLKFLAMSYAITQDERYAHAAAVLFDRLADTYPTATVGSTDYPMKGNHGRLERPQYQTARVLVLLADYLDLLYNSPEFARPSRSGSGTIREHVMRNIIRDGGEYCYKQATHGHMALTNGQADYVRGSLAAGIMLDDKKLRDAAIAGPFRLQNFLDNCIDRDGQYYETSVGYSEHGLHLYIDMAEMLYNMRTEEYPNGIDFYANPRFQRALVDAFIDIDVLGHMPRFGDWGPDTGVIGTDPGRYSRYPYLHSEILVARAKDDAARERWMAVRDYFVDGDLEARRNTKPFQGLAPWFAFHAEPGGKSTTLFDSKPRAVLGGRGIITLRSGQTPDGRAALLRYGASLNHGHKDDLGLNLYALGRELTYDLGYSLGSAHAQAGWTKHTAAHNLVVVNERNQMEAPGSGGSPHYYVDRQPIRAMEASAEASYSSEGVTTYRRTVALVDMPKGGYVVDIFRVEGGHQHDLMWHFGGKLESIGGATMSDPDPKGSLAGPEYEWGHKVGPAGYLIGCADKPDYWNPPPGNGYGFLCDVARGTNVSAECVVTYALADPKTEPRGEKQPPKHSIALRLLLQPDTELVTARAPGIHQDAAKADFTILRRRGDDLASGFISIVEPVEGEAGVKSAKRLTCDTEGCVGVEIRTSVGTDYVLSSMSGEPAVFRTAAGEEIRFTGRFGFLRVSGSKVEKGVLAGGTELSMGSYRLNSDRPQITGTVVAVDNEGSKLTLDTEPISGGEAIIYLTRDSYSRVSPYRMKLVDGKSVMLDGDFVLARGQVGTAKAGSADVIVNIVPLPTARNAGYKTTGVFRGKLITNDRTGETSTVIDTADDFITLRVKHPAKFPAGDSFTIYDIQPGDEFTVPVAVEG